MKPNIVFITSDQQRRDSLGIYGCRYVSTPNLDRLGSQATDVYKRQAVASLASGNFTGR